MEPRPVSTALPTTQNSRPSRAFSAAFEGLGLAFDQRVAGSAVRRSGCSGSGVATVLIGSPTKSARSPPNMRRAERFIHSMPPSPTVTMPTSTESRIARVRSACSATALRARGGARRRRRRSRCARPARRPRRPAAAPPAPRAGCRRAGAAGARRGSGRAGAACAAPPARGAGASRAVGASSAGSSAASSRIGVAGERGHRLVGTLDARRRAGRRCPRRTG